MSAVPFICTDFNKGHFVFTLIIYNNNKTFIQKHFNKLQLHQ